MFESQMFGIYKLFYVFLENFKLYYFFKLSLLIIVKYYLYVMTIRFVPFDLGDKYNNRFSF